MPPRASPGNGVTMSEPREIRSPIDLEGKGEYDPFDFRPKVVDADTPEGDPKDLSAQALVASSVSKPSVAETLEKIASVEKASIQPKVVEPGQPTSPQAISPGKITPPVKV